MVHDIEHCKAVFVSWVWMIGVLVGLVGVVSGGAYVYARAEAKQEQAIEALDGRVVQVQRVYADLDTIKTMLRVR